MSTSATEMSTPYDTVSSLMGSKKPDWLAEMDALRVGSYLTYESIYWNDASSLRLAMRGTNELPKYIPSGRIIVNTMARYVARDPQFVPDPALGTDTERKRLSEFLTALFRRERFLSKFDSNKLMGLVRGDAAWMISADPTKPEGSRISIDTVNPGSVFPITDTYNPDKVQGVDVVEQFLDEENNVYIKRQRWLKPSHPDHPYYVEPEDVDPSVVEADTLFDPEDPINSITYQVDLLELDGWQEEPKYVSVPGETIAQAQIEGIFQLPIYVWNNTYEDDNPWGRSELVGMETLIAGINQAISDQDLALSMAALGMYVTDGGPPKDENGDETDWVVGPGQVVEVKNGNKFERVDGVRTIDPSKGHIEMLEDRMARTSGASDVAQGRVEVAVAESGIALKLRMGPILDESTKKDRLISDTLNQMFYDLMEWIEVFEGLTFGAAAPVAVFGPKLPLDEAARFKMLMEGYTSTPPLFSAAFVRRELVKMGWEIDEDTMMEEIADEMEFYNTAGDEYGNRLGEEEGAGDDLEEGEDGEA